MSGLSLREQLLQAGLVTEKQARQAESSQKRQAYQGNKNLSKRDREQKAAAQVAEQQKAAAAKTARDAELNRKREEKAAAKARWAEIRQIVEQHRIAKPESDDYFNFVLGKKIGRVAVDAALRASIISGASRSSAATDATNCCPRMPPSASVNVSRGPWCHRVRRRKSAHRSTTSTKISSCRTT